MLLAAHEVLFNKDFVSRGATTSTVLRAMRSAILEGSRLFFSQYLYAAGAPIDKWSLPHQAELIGASLVANPTEATHIIVADVESLPRADVESYLAAGSPRVVLWTWLTGYIVSWSRLSESSYSPFPSSGELRLHLPHRLTSVRSVDDLVSTAMSAMSTVSFWLHAPNISVGITCYRCGTDWNRNCGGRARSGELDVLYPSRC